LALAARKLKKDPQNAALATSAGTIKAKIAIMEKTLLAQKKAEKEADPEAAEAEAEAKRQKERARKEAEKLPAEEANELIKKLEGLFS
jgi:cell division ATPase FtsA